MIHASEFSFQKKKSKYVNFDTHVRIVAYGKILSKCESLKKKRCRILKPQFYLLRWITHPDLKCVPSYYCKNLPFATLPHPGGTAGENSDVPHTPDVHSPTLLSFPNVAFHSIILIFKSIF